MLRRHERRDVQSRPNALQQKAVLFDYLVGAREQHRRQFEAERLSKQSEP
jgi:hypothetical protein